ncbi:MAG TPA: RNA polymerase factor sigma-54 [Syntrophorhabdaceae bacterium]|nr:RNA polymerase factor sigma-54 [Syntrophorhabdaceae bacterium]HNT67816.1 RNA polymerase factor sigma-54 [Syntrophorhabdaceae bacterium]
MLELKQTQKLSPILTQQLQQAIKLLQLSKLELVEAIEQEIKENPILEVGEEQAEEQAQETKDDGEEIAELLDRFSPSEEFSYREEKEYPDYENIIKKPSNLRDYLRWQAGLANFDQNERLVVEWIIENIDDNGYLAYPISEISKSSGFSSESLEEVLKKVQKFDPSGVGARDLKECILIQYEALGEKDALLEQILASYFELFHHNNVKGIAKATGYPLDEVKKVFEKIKGFDPKPGRNYSDEYTSYIVPDVYVIKKEDGFEILLNDDDLPELRLNRYYMGLCRDKKTAGDTKKYIKNKLHQAEWFIKSIQQRQRTLYLVAESILKFQREFFEQGLRSLKPLILKDVAQDIGVHESTVSRITTNKYMSCPQGLYELKFFFPTGIDKDGDSPLSTNVVMDLIVEIVKHEDKKSPLTDSEIMDYLKAKQNINIARRTVAKYREGLNIPSSRDRTEQD